MAKKKKGSFSLLWFIIFGVLVVIGGETWFGFLQYIPTDPISQAELSTRLPYKLTENSCNAPGVSVTVIAAQYHNLPNVYEVEMKLQGQVRGTISWADGVPDPDNPDPTTRWFRLTQTGQTSSSVELTPTPADEQQAFANGHGTTIPPTDCEFTWEKTTPVT